MAIYLKNATYIDWKNLSFKLTSIMIEEGAEGKISFLEKIPANKEKYTINCKGKYVTKSFACGHHHAYSALSRGMPQPKKTPKNFHEKLKYVWWALDKCLDKNMIEASALITALYCAKNGVTFVIDHHSSPNAINGSLSIIAQAFSRIGVSHLLCYEMSDRDGEESKNKGLSETEKFLRAGNQALIGLHANFTVGNELMKKAADLVENYNSGIHIHAAEDPIDQEISQREYKKRAIQRLEDYGFLNYSKTILAHCLHLDDSERNILQNSKACIVENIESNLNNKVGYFNSKGLNENIMLGTDGMHSDMIRSAQAAYFVGQKIENIGLKEIYSRLRKVHEYISLNGFSGDGENNLVILDYNPPTEMNKDNFLGHLFYGINSGHIKSVISNGKLIVKDRRILTINEEEALAFAREQSKRLWKKLSTN